MLSEYGEITSCVDVLLLKVVGVQAVGQLEVGPPVICTCTLAGSKPDPLMVMVLGRYCTAGEGLVVTLVTITGAGGVGSIQSTVVMSLLLSAVRCPLSESRPRSEMMVGSAGLIAKSKWP